MEYAGSTPPTPKSPRLGSNRLVKVLPVSPARVLEATFSAVLLKNGGPTHTYPDSTWRTQRRR